MYLFVLHSWKTASNHPWTTNDSACILSFSIHSLRLRINNRDTIIKTNNSDKRLPPWNILTSVSPGSFPLDVNGNFHYSISFSRKFPTLSFSPFSKHSPFSPFSKHSLSISPIGFLFLVKRLTSVKKSHHYLVQFLVPLHITAGVVRNTCRVKDLYTSPQVWWGTSAG